VYWPETGKHTVDVKLAGEDVPGSPFTITASPQQLYLPVCHIFGAGLTAAKAGERSTFVVEAHDARGNRIVTGKATFGLTADSESEAVKGVVVDRGDGRWVGSPMPLGVWKAATPKGDTKAASRLVFEVSAGWASPSSRWKPNPLFLLLLSQALWGRWRWLSQLRGVLHGAARRAVRADADARGRLRVVRGDVHCGCRAGGCT
jgi:hypothetical protein